MNVTAPPVLRRVRTWHPVVVTLLTQLSVTCVPEDGVTTFVNTKGGFANGAGNVTVLLTQLVESADTPVPV